MYAALEIHSFKCAVFLERSAHALQACIPSSCLGLESAGCVRLCVLNMQAARLLPAHCTTERHVLRALSRGCSLRSAVQSIPFGSMYTQSYSAAVFNEAASERLRSLDACRAVWSAASLFGHVCVSVLVSCWCVQLPSGVNVSMILRLYG